MTTRRAPIFGPEPWQGEWSHWDLWMCVVAVLDHGGDLASLERQFVAEVHGGLSFRSAGEEKLSPRSRSDRRNRSHRFVTYGGKQVLSQATATHATGRVRLAVNTSTEAFGFGHGPG